MQNNEICYTSTTYNLHIIEFRWNPFLTDPNPGGKNRVWKIHFVWLFHQFRSTENYAQLRYI
jgi:hypothetical protein